MSQPRAERHKSGIPARIECLDLNEDGSVRMEAVFIDDVSTGGVGISLNRPVEPNTTWQLRNDPSSSRAFNETILIRWVTPRESGTFQCGAQFVSGMSLLRDTGVSSDQLMSDLAMRKTDAVTVRESGVLDTDHDLRVGSIRNLDCRCRGEMHVKGNIENCHIDASKSIDVSRGDVVGGTIQVSGGLRAANLGDDEGTPTTIIVGGKSDAEVLLDKVDQLVDIFDHRIAKIKEELDVLNAIGSDANHEQRERITELIYEQSSTETDRQDTADRAKKLRGLLEDESPKVDLQIDQLIHHNVSICFDQHTYTFTQPVFGPIRITAHREQGLMITHPQTSEPELLQDQEFASHMAA